MARTAKQFQIEEVRWNLIDQGRGPAILFVHGFPLDSSMWRYQVDELSDSFRVIAPDLPGFGLSQSSRGTQPTMESWAADLSRLLDYLDIDQVCFCGLSMGGYIGWQFWKLFPQRVSHLVPCDTRSIADSEEVARQRRVMSRAALERGAPFIADAMLPKLFSESSRRRRPELVQTCRAMMVGVAKETISEAHLAMAAREDATPWLGSIAVPTLVICGEEDLISTPAEMRTIADAIDGAQFATIPNAGHLAPLEQPAAFNQSLREFLR